MKDSKVIVVLASLLLPFICAGVTGSQDIAIQASTLLPISGAPIENGTILIRDGKIAAIGQDIAAHAETTLAKLVDADDIPETIKKRINFTYVKHIDDVIDKALIKKIRKSSKKPTKKSATKKSR